MESLLQFYAIYGSVINFIGINALLALSLNVTLSAGMLSLGNAAFAAIGGYTAGILTMHFHAPYLAALLAGALAAGAAAFLRGFSKRIALEGQTSTHLPQPTHFSRLIRATPSTMSMALVGHSPTQSWQPMHLAEMISATSRPLLFLGISILYLLPGLITSDKMLASFW